MSVRPLPWELTDMPDQADRTILVTGVTSGLGYYTALELARRGARVVLGARDEKRLAATARQLEAEHPGARLEQLVVDLADLSSVRLAAGHAAAFGPIDVLVNNAGVMGTDHQRTRDGFELQMGTNHFGPFLLTGLLLPQLVASGAGRVVSVSSQMHRLARKAPLDEPRTPRPHYHRWVSYAESKLANLLFTAELDRRAREAAIPVKALASHPGFAATHLASNGRYGRPAGGRASILNATIGAVAQPAADGALPSLMAATADLPGGTYCGPDGFQQGRGKPRVVEGNRLSRDPEAARRLWEISEQAVGLTWP
ncbi:oxidoreductase [Nocardioides pacificus]